MKKVHIFLLITIIVFCAAILTACSINVDNNTKQKETSLDYTAVYAYAESAGYTGTLEELI